MEKITNINIPNDATSLWKKDNVEILNLPKYKSILCIGNLQYMCTKSFTEKQKQNWLENFGVEIIDYKEENNEDY